VNFTNFKKKVEATGLKAIDRGRGHYQISGGPMLVNYYPTKGTIYVAGTMDALTDCVQGGQGRDGGGDGGARGVLRGPERGAGIDRHGGSSPDACVTRRAGQTAVPVSAKVTEGPEPAMVQTTRTKRSSPDIER